MLLPELHLLSDRIPESHPAPSLLPPERVRLGRGRVICAQCFHFELASGQKVEHLDQKDAFKLCDCAVLQPAFVREAAAQTRQCWKRLGHDLIYHNYVFFKSKLYISLSFRRFQRV